MKPGDREPEEDLLEQDHQAGRIAPGAVGDRPAEGDQAEVGRLAHWPSGVEVTFLPGDPPRRGRFALHRPDLRRLDQLEAVLAAPWGPRVSGAGGRRLSGEAGEVQLVLPTQLTAEPAALPAEPGAPPASRSSGSPASPRLRPATSARRPDPGRMSLRRRTVPAFLLPVHGALGPLLELRGEATASALAWAAVLSAGLTIIAKGRLQPALTGSGLDAWRVGPLDPGDLRLLEAVAEAMPPVGHGAVLDKRAPLRVHSPRFCGPRRLGRPSGRPRPHAGGWGRNGSLLLCRRRAD